MLYYPQTHFTGKAGEENMSEVVQEQSVVSAASGV